MLQAIEVIVEPNGVIRPLEELHVDTLTRSVLTLFETPKPPAEQAERGDAAAVLALLRTPRFASRPTADPKEIEQRMQELRNG